MWQKCVALVDMVAFFPSCEQLDFPEFKGKPIAVTNGDAGTTIISSSYEARAYGVKTGMHLNEARTLYPNIIQRPSRPERYAEISANIMNGLRNITPDMEVFSIDECFMDLKPVLSLYGSVQKIAELIRNTVLGAGNGMVCSIGISEGKLTAKFCAGLNKGKTTIVPPNKIQSYMAEHDLARLCGIGPSLLSYLNNLGYYKFGDMVKAPPNLLSGVRGDTGHRLQSACLGVDPIPVKTEFEKAKSMGHSKVLPPYSVDRDKIEGVLHQLSNRLTRRLRDNGFVVNQVTISFQAHKQVTKETYKFPMPTNSSKQFIYKINNHLKLWKNEPLFQVGLHCHQLIDEAVGQQSLFTSEEDKVDKVKDEINKRFGKNSCRNASEMQADDLNMVPVIAFNFDATSKSKNSL
jgi:DNA polymerase-4